MEDKQPTYVQRKAFPNAPIGMRDKRHHVDISFMYTLKTPDSIRSSTVNGLY